MISGALLFFKNCISKFYYDSKLKYKMIVSYLTFILIVILFLGLASRFVLQGYIQDYEKKLLTQNMNQLNNAIDSFFEIYMSKSDMLFDNLDLQEAITKVNESLSDTVASHNKIRTISNQFLSDFRYPFIKSSYYFGGAIRAVWYLDNDSLRSDGYAIFNYSSIKDEEWCQNLMNSKNIMFSWQSGVTYKGSEYIVMNRKLIEFNAIKNIGVLRIYIPVARVKNIISGNIQSEDYDFLYMDGNKAVIFTGNLFNGNEKFFNKINNLELKSETSYVTLDKEKYIGGYLNSEVTGWRLIYLTPMKFITEKTKFIDLITLITILISIILCIIIATLVSSFVTKRVGILVEKTNKITGGNFKVDLTLKGNDEIGQLDKNFNSMIGRINNLIESEYKSKITISKTKLELLQEQINPHLLYNTLSTISYISKKSSQSEIMNVSNNLIIFYRGILNGGKIISNLGAEIDMAKRYCEIMKFVYNLNIEVNFDIDEEILDCYSIKLFLQPIVENSIIHGVRTVESGTVTVSTKVLNGDIQFIVSDNGVGISEENLSYLRSLAKNGTGDKGYGLSNVIGRIKLFYGNGYGMDIESAPGRGTTTVITIPKLTEAEIHSLLEGKYLA